MKDTTISITMKELEQITFRALQESFSEVMAKTLTELDESIASKRDKKRFHLKDKRALKFDSMFGSVALNRNYYLDNETGKYVYLLDQYLAFDGQKGVSPVVQDLAIELAVKGVSYRQASEAMDKLLGYPVISHEGIRQQLLNTSVTPEVNAPLEEEVIFVEVDGLYTKSQEKGKKGREVKIASVHQGWEMNGTRASLKDKRHFIHQEKLPFWEEFEQYLMATHNYDPTKHRLVINGDGAKWITSCQSYFRKNAIFVIDRFHVARDVQRLFRGHQRYREIRKKLVAYDWEGFITELNSAVGTLENDKKEEHLEKLIDQLSQYPKALGDYRKKLEQEGIDVKGYRPMGSAEGTMSVFAKRLKNGRSWCDIGLDKFIDLMVAFKDNLEVITLQGDLKQSVPFSEDEEHSKPPKHFVERLKRSAVEATRNNIGYLKGTIGKPVVHALKGLKGL